MKPAPHGENGDSTSNNPLARLPGVDALLQTARGQQLAGEFGRKAVTSLLRESLAALRHQLKQAPEQPLPAQEIILQAAADALSQRRQARLRPLFNLTGTVLHTNLGRATLPDSAIAALTTVAGSASNLEFDLASGKRGDRDAHIEAMICDITGAEAATVVNNNAAAVVLVLNALARNQEVPVSRGELVEIGGSFRIPEIMASAGCTLVEVGATNRTHGRDFNDAITPGTALLMKVHTSNYEIKGFASSVPETELADIAHAHDLPFVNDLGSGTLVDLRKFGLPWEPTAQSALAEGADLVTFSGDKLLGGPQAGIIVGRKDLIARLKASPLKRALRVDKLTMAALDEVLRLYQQPDTLVQLLPTLRHLTRSQADIQALAAQLLPAFRHALEGFASIEVVDCMSQIGSGALPLDTLPSCALALTPTAIITPPGTSDLEQLALVFRQLPRPVIGRLNNDQLLLDLRTLDTPQALLDQLDSLRNLLNAS